MAMTPWEVEAMQRQLDDIRARHFPKPGQVQAPTPSPVAMLADLVQPYEEPMAQKVQAAGAPLRDFYNWLGREGKRLTSWGPPKPGDQSGAPGGGVPFL